MMIMKEAEVKNVESLEERFGQLITEWNQDNELGKKAQQESAALSRKNFLESKILAEEKSFKSIGFIQ